MEKAYWLSRKRRSLESAKDALSAEARLIHYDLAGRYSVKAHSAETQEIDLADAQASDASARRSLKKSPDA